MKSVKQRKNKQEVNLLNPRAAGRPRVKKYAHIPRYGREKLHKNTPLHITIKLKKEFIHNLRTKESLFRDRYHLVQLRTPTQTKRVLHYIA